MLVYHENKEAKIMKICGLQKTTLLDFPGHVAATIFLGGCNFRCPFC
ncbi:MAG: anaerobic ribonucleoside-triphosphate reductase activating protein, partial [Clostridiaceae bacterium]|nr:anaerobic ribonucleoside-triphosphate reductase activating protein [Clostridiaceae bacterium]